MAGDRAGSVWIVEPDEDLRALLREIAPSATVLDSGELSQRLTGGAVPAGLLADGTALIEADPRHPGLERIPRIVVITGRSPGDLPAALVDRENVRLVTKPFGLAEVERELDWLSGSPGADAAEAVSQRPPPA